MPNEDRERALRLIKVAEQALGELGGLFGGRDEDQESLRRRTVPAAESKHPALVFERRAQEMRRRMQSLHDDIPS